jgi:hypothetical protein
MYFRKKENTAIKGKSVLVGSPYHPHWVDVLVTSTIP